ncbi:MAG: hypothetical protein LBN33_07370 [Desulfovibrio sp.]|nr:hypothetical protein [Desulfovibrio sp.]
MNNADKYSGNGGADALLSGQGAVEENERVCTLTLRLSMLEENFANLCNVVGRLEMDVRELEEKVGKQ